MENNKQTAVEWLVEQLRMQTPLYTKNEMIEMAKQMEKVNNEYSWIAGAEYSISVLKDKTLKESKESFEQYYNETYKTKTQ